MPAPGYPSDELRRIRPGFGRAEGDSVVAQPGERTREGRGQGPDQSVDRVGGRGPVDQAVIGQSSAGITRLGLVLGLPVITTQSPQDRIGELLSLDAVQSLVEVTYRVARSDGHQSLEEDPAGVELRLERVHADGRVRLAVDDRPVHDGAAPIPGERRVVHVDEGKRDHQVRREDPVVGGHHDDVGRGLGARLLDAPQGHVRADLDPVLVGQRQQRIARVARPHDADNLERVRESAVGGECRRALPDQQHSRFTGALHRYRPGRRRCARRGP